MRIVTFVVLASMSLSPPALAASGFEEVGGVVGRWASPAEGGMVWTDEAMREATPLPLPEHEPVPQRPRSGTATPEGYTYPAPFARYRLFPNTAYPKAPHGAVGKLFFNRGGVGRVCSAAAIGNYAIWTAGHCLYDPSTATWSTDIAFVPQYRSGSRPKGTWTWAAAFTTANWIGSNDYGSDFGFVILNALNGKALGQVVPGLNIAWNISPEQQWMILGYPSASPFSGETQFVCATSYSYSDTTFSPPTTGTGCDQTGGSSGGPWIVSYRDGNFLNGNVSYRRTSNPLEIFSPYFGNAAKAFYDCAVSSTPVGLGPAC